MSREEDVKLKSFREGYDLGAEHMLKSAREWWKSRLRSFVSDEIAEGIVNEFCEDMDGNYE